MSNILRRPMFRGGKVSSYGNGIASGMGYAVGGPVTPKPKIRVTAGIAPAGQATTGGSLLQNAISSIKSTPYLGRVASPLINLASKAGPAFPFATAAGAGYGLGSLADFFYEGMSTPEKYIETKRIGEEEPFAYAETDLIVNEDGTSPGSTTTRGAQIDKYLGEINVGEKPGFFPRGGTEKWMRDRGYDLETGKKISDVQPSENALDNILREAGRVTKSDFSSKKDTEEKINLTAEEMIAANKELFRKELGYDQARRSDIGDLLGRISVAALKKPGRGETRDLGDIAGDVMAMELAAGPGRREKIDQSAAALAINDYIAGKRSKEQLDSILAKTKFGVDYQAEAAGRATAVSGGESQEDWLRDLRNVASRTRDKQITDTDVIRTTLFERFKLPVNIKAFNKKTLESIVNENAKDLSVGFNIVIAKDGKVIIEKKPNGQSRIRTDLPIT